MTTRLLACVFAAILSLAAFAQTPPEPPPQTPPPAETPAPPPTETAPAEQPEKPVEPMQVPQPAPPPPAEPEPPPAPSVLSDVASGAYERRDSLPALNLYFPEGEASVRLRKLIKNVLFESQIDYEFVNGDISTFLRYKYYARNYTYRLGVFDSLEFGDLASSSEKEFERVRGGLLLVGFPKDYSNRYFVLLQDDRLTFGDADRPDNRKNNIYLKVGYQFGTQFDERMNSIVGEQRGRITPVLTAFRDIGPQRTGLAAAITQSGEVATGDYTYTKLEAEGLRRFDITSTSFLFSRLHVGAFLSRNEVDPVPPLRDRDGDGIPDPTPQWELYQVPQYELFRLGGREALKSVKINDSSLGTYEAHLTNEFFVPIFRNRDYRLGRLYWNTLYAIGYIGAGTVGYKTADITDTKRIVVDAGIGTEHAITFGEYDVYLSVIYAKAVRKPEGVEEGNGFRFSIRTVR
ncbi:MAG TPA: hypothetical protein VNA69_09080 [Thermoanaerobaculia bacterium]|nr:hypothetical protein [Thermoanaerobaculia bacterium]